MRETRIAPDIDRRRTSAPPKEYDMTNAQNLGLTPGTWNIDPIHSSVGFSVRHMMVSKVKGQFEEFTGQITVADQIEDSSVQASIVVSSINTHNAQRDEHVKSSDFWNADAGQTIDFTSTNVVADGDDWLVVGDLTMNGITKPATLKVEFGGSASDGQGGTKAGFEATTEILRSEYGIDFNMPMDGGGVVIGDKVAITLDIQAAKA